MEIVGIRPPQTKTVTGVEMYRKCSTRPCGRQRRVSDRGVDKGDMERGKVVAQAGFDNSLTRSSKAKFTS